MSPVPKLPLRRQSDSAAGRAAEARAIIAGIRPVLEQAEAAGLPVVADCLVTAIAKAEEEIQDQQRER